MDYRTADLCTLPDEWVFDLVAPGGSLLAVENVRAEDEALSERPPWAFTRAEITSFAEHGLDPVTVEQLDDGVRRWRAEFLRRAP